MRLTGGRLEFGSKGVLLTDPRGEPGYTLADGDDRADTVTADHERERRRRGERAGAANPRARAEKRGGTFERAPGPSGGAVAAWKPRLA